MPFSVLTMYASAAMDTNDDSVVWAGDAVGDACGLEVPGGFAPRPRQPAAVPPFAAPMPVNWVRAYT